MKSLCAALGTATFSVVLVASALGLLADRLWLGELAANLRWHLGIGALAALPLLALGGARWRAAAATAIAVAHLWPAVSLAMADPPVAPPGVELRLASVNLLASNRSTDAIDAWLLSESPDVVVLLEVSEFWRRHLDDGSLSTDYPYRVVEPRVGEFGIAVLSRLPIASHAVLEVGQPGIPYIEAVFDHAGCEVRVLAVHTFPPVTPSMRSARNAILDELLTRVGEPPPTVVAGDLNATLYSPAFRRFVTEAGLVDSRTGVGRSPSWMPTLGPAGLDLDHVLTTAGIVTRSRRIGPSFGSDHAPVAVDLVRSHDACRAPAGAGHSRLDGGRMRTRVIRGPESSPSHLRTDRFVQTSLSPIATARHRRSGAMATRTSDPGSGTFAR